MEDSFVAIFLHSVLDFLNNKDLFYYSILLIPIIYIPFIVILARIIEMILFMTGLLRYYKRNINPPYGLRLFEGLIHTTYVNEYMISFFITIILTILNLILGLIFFQKIILLTYPLLLSTWYLLIRWTFIPLPRNALDFLNYQFDSYTLEPYRTRSKRKNLWSYLKGLIQIGRSDFYKPIFEQIFLHKSYSDKSLLANFNYIKTLLENSRGVELRKRLSEEIFKYSISVFLLLIVASIVTNSLLIDNLIDQKQLINPNIGNTNYLNSLSYSVGLFFANGLEGFQRNNIHALVIIYSYAILFFALTLFLSFTGSNIDRSINRLFFRMDLYCDELKKLIDYMINMIELGEYGKLSKELEKRFSWNKEVMNFIQHLPDKK